MGYFKQEIWWIETVWGGLWGLASVFFFFLIAWGETRASWWNVISNIVFLPGWLASLTPKLCGIEGCGDSIFFGLFFLFVAIGSGAFTGFAVSFARFYIKRFS